MDLSAIAIIDHHCHTLRRPGPALDGDVFRRFFSESTDPAMAPHIGRSVFYMRLLRDMAALLGCEPSEQALLALRAATPPEDYARRLLAAGNFRMLLVDTGFPTVDSLDLPELGALAGCPAAPILRLETLMEQLIAASATFAQVEEGLREAVRGARAQGVVGLKSIAAYRGGLHVERRSLAEAAAEFPALRERAGAMGGCACPSAARSTTCCSPRSRRPPRRSCRSSSMWRSATTTPICGRPTRCRCARC